MVFGKPGRPAEDRLARQREIYEAVVPLLARDGARRLQMREAAHAACLSLGGLYHYFPTKRDLIFHGLDWDARSRLCREYHERIAGLRAGDLDAYLAAYLDHMDRMLVFIRPSVQAALELGNEEFQDVVEDGFRRNISELKASLRVVAPHASERTLRLLGSAIRRYALGVVADRRPTPADEIRVQVRALIVGHLAAEESPIPRQAMSQPELVLADR